MGLDILVHEGATTKVAESMRDISENEYESRDCFSAYNDGVFVGREAPLQEGRIYEHDGETWHFRAGSYSGYNRYREELCRLALGVEPLAVWADPESWSSAPFFEQIHFSDCEGTIGQDAARKLADDYEVHRARAREGMSEYAFEVYELFAKAFARVAEHGGAVDFC